MIRKIEFQNFQRIMYDLSEAAQAEHDDAAERYRQPGRFFAEAAA
jgi:hypothetical protein